ncbi:hypothetical protein AGMMS50239_09690 [Bacteroidia bacterium]|nr:hypothetical protein AGMMS50239_09690 [Bacteroidia bacterium]
MRKEYKITIYNLIRELSFLFLTLAFLLFTLYQFYISDVNLPDTHKKLFWITIVWIVFFLYGVIYPLIIYWNHYSHDKNVILIIDNKLDEFIYKNGNIHINVKVSDIRYAKSYYCSLRGYMMHYYELFLNNDNTPIIVTSLLAPNLLKKLPYVKKGRESIHNMFI